MPGGTAPEPLVGKVNGPLLAGNRQLPKSPHELKKVSPSTIGAAPVTFTSDTRTVSSLRHSSAGNPAPEAVIVPPAGTEHGPGTDVPHVKVTVGAICALVGAAGPRSVCSTIANPKSRRSGAERRAILCISLELGGEEKGRRP